MKLNTDPIWYRGFLTNRSQAVRLNNVVSSQINVFSWCSSGIRAGSDSVLYLCEWFIWDFTRSFCSAVCRLCLINSVWKYRIYLGINRKSRKYLINKILLSKEWPVTERKENSVCILLVHNTAFFDYCNLFIGHIIVLLLKTLEYM